MPVITSQDTSVSEDGSSVPLIFAKKTNPLDDIALQCIDGVDLYTNKTLLAYASSFFTGMFTLPQPTRELQSSREHDDDRNPGSICLPVIDSSKAWDRLLRWIHPLHTPLLEDLADIRILVGPCVKYDMVGVREAVHIHLKSRLHKHPAESLRIWAIAVSWRIQPLADFAARLTVNRDLVAPESSANEARDLDLVPASSFHALLLFGNSCRAKLHSILEDSTQNPLHEGYRRIYRTCHAKNCSGAHDVYTAWVNNYINSLLQFPKRESPGDTIRHSLEGISMAKNTDLSSCNECRPTIAKKFPELITSLADIVDSALNEVPIPKFWTD